MALGEEDFGLLHELVHSAFLSGEACDLEHVHRAAEAVLTVLSGGSQKVDLQLKSPPGADDDSVPQPPVIEESSTVAELGAQISAAVERVSALRRRATQIVYPAVAAQLEALRPAQESIEFSLLTPGRPDRAISEETEAVQRNAASAANDNLLKAADKLPALRARIDEVSKRMSNVMRAIEEQQKAIGKSQPATARAGVVAVADSDWIVGVIGRTTRQ